MNSTCKIETKILTGRQANVMDHALAFPKLSRNGFEATDGSLNDETWKELVTLGYAAKVEGFSMSGKTKYQVSETGIKTLQTFHDAMDVESENSCDRRL